MAHPTTHADGALANVPTGHVEAVYAQEDAPAVLNAPAGQDAHEEFTPNVPAAHGAQEPAALL